MLKDIGMAVPKAREAVSKQKIMACNNNTIRKPHIKKRCREGLNRLGLLRNHCHPYTLQHFNGNVLHWFSFSNRNSCMPYYVSINSIVQEFCAV